MERAHPEDKDDDLFEEECFKKPDSLQPPEKLEAIERAPVVIPDPLTDRDPPEDIFYIEIIKNGLVILRKPIRKSRIIFGRLKDADIQMEHPSVSRNHACLLWNPNDGEDGSFFLIDLNSVHGTFINKEEIEPSKPYKITPGNDLIKIGGSTRMFYLNSSRQPENHLVKEEEEEEIRKRKEEEANKSGSDDDDEKEEDPGCTWGMNDDVDEDDINNDYLTPLGQVLSLLQTGIGSEKTPNEDSFCNDPQKVLRTWFDQEGYDFEFKVNCVHNKFKCILDVPIDGQSVNFEGDTHIKVEKIKYCLLNYRLILFNIFDLYLQRKDAIQDVCLKACRILDKADLLYAWQKRREARKKRENESDSDGDMIDETDQYKQKKAKRDALREGIKYKIENYDTLNERWKELSIQIASFKAKLAQMNVQSKKIAVKIVKPLKESEANEKEESEDDPLESFMADIKKSESNATKTPLEFKIEISKLKSQITSLEMEQRKVERMLEIAKPRGTL